MESNPNVPKWKRNRWKIFFSHPLNRRPDYECHFSHRPRQHPRLVAPAAVDWIDAVLDVYKRQPQNPSGDWQRVGTVLLAAAKGGKIDPAVQDYAAMADAFKNGSVASFNSALADLRSALIPNFSRALAKTRAEVFFNQMQPFYNAMAVSYTHLDVYKRQASL